MPEGYLTTHVLDAARGCPAAGLRIELFKLDGERRQLVREVFTNADGRTDTPVIPKGEATPGTWELLFHAGPYLDAAGLGGEAPPLPRRRSRSASASPTPRPTTTSRCCWRRTAIRRIGGADGFKPDWRWN